MGELARYRLFLSFLAVPVVVIVLIVVLLVNAFGGDDNETPPTEQQTAVAQVEPTLAISVVTVAPAQTSPAADASATVTPTATPLAIAAATNTPVPPPVEPTPTTGAAATPASAPRGTSQEYEVQPNDTLSEIADSFGLTSAELAEANEIENPDEIQVGDILIIPATASGDDRTPAATPTPIPTSATVDPEEGLNVREEPTTDSDVLEVLLGGAEILLTGTRQTIDDIEWVELVDGGWVQSQYLTIEGE